MSAKVAPKNNVFYRNQHWEYPKVTHGKGVYLYTEDGKKYLDGCSGSAVANIGHGSEEVAAYTAKQIEKIAFTHLSRWTVDTIEDCAAKVADWAPGDLNHVYFLSGGSEATETAVKLARQYYTERDIHTSKWKVISKWNSYHGNTLGSLSMSGITGRRKIFSPYLMDFPKIPQFYHYRNVWDCKDLYSTSVKAAEALEEEIIRQGSENIAAFITEPVIGSAAPGVHPHKIYFDMVREICTRHDILLIVDEVMSGFGRTGKRFGVDHYDVVPDIMVVAKGMSCGYTPMGAVIASEEIFNTIMVEGSGQFVHGHTYAGNPLSCGIALKVMEIVEREGYIKNAELQGDYLMSRLQELKKHKFVGEIRGKGLMIGIEFVKNKIKKKPFALETNAKGLIMKKCLEEGLVIYPGGGSVNGQNGDHILIAPPLNITRAETEELFVKLKAGIEKAEKELSNVSKEDLDAVSPEVCAKLPTAAGFGHK